VRGLYLALEGVEGAGKSTVARILGDLMRQRGHTVTMVREPGSTELGESIRQILLHAGDMAPWAEAALFAAQRAQLVTEIVRPALEAGRLVISDRSYYSSLAYQGGARKLGVEGVRMLNELALDGTVPDFVVVLDVEPRTALGRQQVTDRIGGGALEFFRAAAATYRKLAIDEPDRVRLLPASGTPEEIGTAIAGMIEERWNS